MGTVCTNDLTKKIQKSPFVQPQSTESSPTPIPNLLDPQEFKPSHDKSLSSNSLSGSNDLSGISDQDLRAFH